MRNKILIPVLLVAFTLLLSGTSRAQFTVVITTAPPPLPVYEQPLCPAEGYLWVPGYWAYDYDYNDYFWVPGTWVLAPEPGLLWTPGYWGWGGDRFLFHEGYWGPHVGFYGGINYGFGYYGEGYEGGRWDRDRFFYNRAVNHINEVEIHNVYNTTVINRTTTYVSYNGGNGGINARPTREDEDAGRERHIAPVPVQVRHVESARAEPNLRASANQGRPPIAATPRPASFRDPDIVAARQAGAPYEPPARRAFPNGPSGTGPNVPRTEPPRVPVHPNELPPMQRPPAPATGDQRLDQKYHQQQEKLWNQQQQERQRLQQKQEQDHQRVMQQQADDARRQQMEQRHQQQTQQMQEHQSRQVQKMQERQQPRGPSNNPHGGGYPRSPFR